jgi:hypothetical protein
VVATITWDARDSVTPVLLQTTERKVTALCGCSCEHGLSEAGQQLSAFESLEYSTEAFSMFRSEGVYTFDHIPHAMAQHIGESKDGKPACI